MGVMPGWADEPDPLAGAGVAEDLSALTSSLANGDWAEAELHGLSAGMGLLGAVVDPVGALAAAGAGWAMEHVGPLRTWLDDLAGDPPAVMADSARLDDASREVTTAAGDLRRGSASLLAMEGLSIEACRRFTHDTARDADQFATLLQAGAAAMRLASGIVDAVRTLVRDAIAELVGMATSSAVTVALTAGAGTPVVMARVALRAEMLVVRLSGTLKSMARSFEALRLLLVRAETALGALARTSRARRPTRGPLHPATPVTWSSEVVKSLSTIRPPLVLADIAVGAAATVVAGPGDE
ncbi:hypothetical protein [Nocardioides gilvus]|uniref:hypothetical protein n=1 Tax=Nocardioides gilvus TaxID=1735589 RepID=UPI000D750294|nr:hypothetical protein [Nocardioides gilvus]